MKRRAFNFHNWQERNELLCPLCDARITKKNDLIPLGMAWGNKIACCGECIDMVSLTCQSIDKVFSKTEKEK